MISKLKQVVIAGKPYAIEWLDSKTVGRVGEDIGKSQSLGVIESTAQKMWIAKQHPSATLLETFWHEVLHAIDEDRMLKLSERIIQNIANGITDVLLINFDLKPKKQG